MGKFSFLSRRSNMLWLVVIGLAALAQGASVDVEEIQVNATDESEFESLLAANDQLFDFQLLKPLKRSLFEITMEDIMEINKTQPRSLIPEDRATTDCGCGQTPATGRIVNGAEVSPMHSRPYQAFLQSCSTQGCAMCGATLINKRYAITAMHCVEGATNLVVSLGEHKLGANVESLAPQTIRVERVIRRPDYTESNVNNDIAILKLSSEVVLNNNVVPACLPTDSAKTYSGQTAYVSGWGTTSEGGSTSDTLKVTSQTVLSNSDPAARETLEALLWSGRMEGGPWWGWSPMASDVPEQAMLGSMPVFQIISHGSTPTWRMDGVATPLLQQQQQHHQQQHPQHQGQCAT